MPSLAASASSMPRSGIRRVMDMAWSMPDPVIGLHVGEPSFAAPAHVVAAAQEAYARGETHYVPNAGIPQLREAITAKLAARNGLAVSPGRIVVTQGAAQALHLAFTLTTAAGDEVLVPDPGWPNFAMAVGLVQARPVPYPLDPADGFLPDPDRLARLVTPRTRAIVVNTPSNPLGTVLPAELVADLAAFAERHDLWLISDECYDALTFDAEHVSAERFDTGGRVLSAFSFSKSYAMTGVRVGYLVAPDEAVGEVAAKLQEPLVACVNAPAQWAAVAALEGPQDAVAAMRDAYRERRDAAVKQLEGDGIGHVVPQGAFYLWVDVRDRCGGDVGTWALGLLRAQHVAVAPGTAFGAQGEGWVRVSLAADGDALLEGLRRLAVAR